MTDSYKQIRATKLIVKGKDFPAITAAVKEKAEASKWRDYGWLPIVRKAKYLNKICELFGVSLCYEGDDKFTIDIDGAPDSAFLEVLFGCMAPYATDGEIVAKIERKKNLFQFKDGKFELYEI